MRMLEIGPGDTRLGPGWETVDCRPRPCVGRIATWGSANELPYDADEFDLVYASHVLEHVPWFNTAAALADVYRILKSGGIFEVWVPDFAYLVECYDNGECGDDWRKHNENNDPMLWLNGRLFTYGGPGGLADPNWHRAVFDWPYLRRCLLATGFRTAERIDATERPRGHDHGPINLGARAVK